MDTLLSHVFTVNADYVICTRKDEVPVRPLHIRYLCQILGINANPRYFLGKHGTSADVRRSREILGHTTYFAPPGEYVRLPTVQNDIKLVFPRARQYVSRVSEAMIPYAKGEPARHGFGLLKMLRMMRHEKTTRLGHLYAVAFAAGIPPQHLWVEMCRRLVRRKMDPCSAASEDFSIKGYERFCEMGMTARGISYEAGLNHWLDASLPILEGLAYSAIVQMHSHHPIALTGVDEAMRLVCYNPHMWWRRKLRFELPFRYWSTLSADTIKEIQDFFQERYVPVGFYSDMMLPNEHEPDSEDIVFLRNSLAMRSLRPSPDIHGGSAVPASVLSWCGLRRFPCRGVDFSLYSPPKVQSPSMTIDEIYTSRCEGGVNFITKYRDQYKDYQILKSFALEGDEVRSDIEAMLWILRQSEAELWQI